MSGSRVKALRRLFKERTGRAPLRCQRQGEGSQKRGRALRNREEHETGINFDEPSPFAGYLGPIVERSEVNQLKAKWREYLRSGGENNVR